MNKNNSAFSGKAIRFATSFVSIAVVSGISVAIAAITFSNTSITGDSSFNNLVEGTSTASADLIFIASSSPIFVVSSTGKVGIGTDNPSTAFEVAGMVSSTELRTPSSTISTITSTNSSGTRITAATSFDGPQGNITNVSSTRITAATSLDTAKVISTNVSSTNLTASTYVQAATTTITGGNLILGTSNTDGATCVQTFVKGTTTVFWIGVNTSTYSLFATSTKPAAFCN